LRLRTSSQDGGSRFGTDNNLPPQKITLVTVLVNYLDHLLSRLFTEWSGCVKKALERQ
jgi:hypothetical protein